MSFLGSWSVVYSSHYQVVQETYGDRQRDFNVGKCLSYLQLTLPVMRDRSQTAYESTFEEEHSESDVEKYKLVVWLKSTQCVLFLKEITYFVHIHV